MSNHLAIATVTAALKHTLLDALSDLKGDKDITTTRPDSTSDSHRKLGANIYLYQVTPNTTWRNDLPTRNSNGQATQRPRIALDLHYLISCYGDDSKLEPQRVLGLVVRRFLELPILDRRRIQKVVDGSDILKGSNLADEIQAIKFSSAALSLEELSKLWTVFLQTPYALSVAYQASVVFIDSEEAPMTIRPVSEPKIYVQPVNRPVIETIVCDKGSNEPILFDSKLVVRGNQLRGETTLVRLGGFNEAIIPERASADQITLKLPPGPTAGQKSLTILHQTRMGVPEVNHNGFESNTVTFLLCPIIKAPSSKVIQKKNKNNTLPSATLEVENIRPRVERRQRVLLLLDESGLVKDKVPHGYVFPAPDNNGLTDPKENDTDVIAFSIGGVHAGKYLIRIQVDGAESPSFTDSQKREVLAEVDIS